ncbi:lactose/L-arabinose transport system substrate-binding protein [Enterococcus sp. AZ194]|uniref:ABC transporter substrate-binding protein n=1 Tax=Enterococcus sp. AZ194 TaxID=2774629 RepID=UPI003F2363CA
MKKDIQKRVVVGVLLMLLILVSGCSKKEDQTLKNFNVNQEPVKEATLSIYVPQGKNENYITKSIELYNKKYGADIKTNITNVTPGGSTTQMISPKMVAHEKMPEIIFIQDTNAAGILQLFSDSFLSASDFGFYDKYAADFYEPKVDVLNKMSEGGRATAFPNDFGVAVTYYQPELFKAVGANFEDINSWDELIDIGIKIKEKTGHQLLALSTAGEVEQVSAIMDQLDTPLMDSSGNINLGSKAAKISAETLQKLIDNNLIAWTTDSNGEKVKQDMAINLTGSFYASNMQMNFPSAKDKWRVAEFVPFSEENPGKTPLSGGSSWYVPKDCDYPLAAAQVLTFMLTDPDALKIALEEGVMISNREAFKTDAAHKEFEYFGNQKILEIVAKANENGAAINIFPNSTDSRAYVGAASYAYWKTNDFENSYVREATNFAKKYGLKVNK